MKRSGGLFFLVFIFSILLLTGCNKDRSSIEKKPNAASEQELEDARDENKDKSNGQANSQSSEEIPKMQEIPIYTVDEETSGTKATVVMMPSDYKITAKLIVQLVVTDIEDKSYQVKVNKVSAEGTNVIVDFSSKTPPVTDVTEQVETTILDAIAQSILDNLSQYNGVIYQIDGKAYHTDNKTFGLNDIYLSR